MDKHSFKATPITTAAVIEGAALLVEFNDGRLLHFKLAGAPKECKPLLIKGYATPRSWEVLSERDLRARVDNFNRDFKEIKNA